MRSWSMIFVISMLLTTVYAGAEVVIPLQPSMPAVELTSAPAIWASPPDADKALTALQIDAIPAYEWVVTTGHAFSAKVACGQAGYNLLLTVWNWNRTPVAQRAFTSPFSDTLRFDVTGRGSYLLTLDAFKGSECVGRLTRSFSVCPSNRDKQAIWLKGEFQPGCCAFPGRENWGNDYGPGYPKGMTEDSARTLDAELSARLGLVVVRPDIAINQSQGDKTYDFTKSDACMKAWTDRGFKLALQVVFPYGTDWAVLPKYANVKDPKWRYPHSEAVMRKFTQEVVARYRNDLYMVEAFNEPDNLDFWRGSVDEFIDTNRWTCEEAHKAAPGVPVITGGICLMDPERTGEIIRRVRTTVQGVGYHSHGGIETLQLSMTSMRTAHSAAGYAKPVFYNTEMGYANWHINVERNSAATAIEKLLYCWAHGNRLSLLYASRENVGPRSAGDWGFLDYTFCPRFSYGAIAAFCDWYAGAKFRGIVVEANGLFAYTFSRDGKTLAPVFVSQEGTRKVSFGTDAKSAQLVDPMGNASPAVIKDGVITFDAELYPQTLVLEGATRFEAK